MRGRVAGLRGQHASVSGGRAGRVALLVRAHRRVPPAAQVPRRSAPRGRAVRTTRAIRPPVRRRSHAPFSTSAGACRRRHRGHRPDSPRRARREEQSGGGMQTGQVDQHVGVASGKRARVRRIGLRRQRQERGIRGQPRQCGARRTGDFPRTRRSASPPCRRSAAAYSRTIAHADANAASSGAGISHATRRNAPPVRLRPQRRHLQRLGDAHRRMRRGQFLRRAPAPLRARRRSPGAMHRLRHAATPARAASPAARAGRARAPHPRPAPAAPTAGSPTCGSSCATMPS